MRNPYARTVHLLVALLVAGVSTAGAQSLTSITGLGYPILPSDARAEALGGLGIGVFGMTVPFTNPASVVDVRRRGVVVTAVTDDRTATMGNVSQSSGSTRFPLMRIIVPLGDVVVTGGYGSFLDQSWAVTRTGSVMLGGEPTSFTDILRSVGGIGQARVGVAMPLGDRLAVGLSLGSYTGRQDLTVQRRFDSTAVGVLEPYGETRAARYSGFLAQAGIRWDLGSEARVGASVTWSGTLTADSASGVTTSREYDLPIQVAAGASAYLAPGILAAVSGRWSDWSVTDPSGGLIESEVPASSRDTWEIGGGIELDDPERRQARSFPLRLGFQYRQLPFTFVGDNPTEWLASAGIGMRIGADFNTPLARIDLTVQRGERSATGGNGIPALEETLWRFALGVSIFGT